MFLWTERDDIVNTDHISRMGVDEVTSGVFKIAVDMPNIKSYGTYLRWGHKTHFDTKEEARNALLEIRMRLNEWQK